MDFLRFLFSRQFLKHLLLASGIFGVLLWITLQSLAWYTHHDDYLIVPDFRGQEMSLMTGNQEYANYRFTVIDSIFDPDKAKGIVITQDPYPGSKVKKDRMIYVTTTSFVPEKTTMPDLCDLTLRQALSILESAGLKPGKIQYIRSFDEDAVQNQFYKGRVIRPGTSLDKGSVITLTVGMGAKASEISDTIADPAE